MRDIMLGILSGIGEAHQKQQQNLLSQEVDRRKNLAQFWKSQAEHPDTRPEARDIATRKYLGIVQTPFDKKLPKEIETIDDYLTVQPQQGTSWPGAERQIPMMPSPSPKPEGVAPTAPPESSISAPMPAPPPEYRVPAQYTMQERGAQRRQAAQETADIAVDAETRKAQAEAKARRDYAIPVPPKPLGFAAGSMVIMPDGTRFQVPVKPGDQSQAEVEYQVALGMYAEKNKLDAAALTDTQKVQAQREYKEMTELGGLFPVPEPDGKGGVNIRWRERRDAVGGGAARTVFDAAGNPSVAGVQGASLTPPPAVDAATQGALAGWKLAYDELGKIIPQLQKNARAIGPLMGRITMAEVEQAGGKGATPQQIKLMIDLKQLIVNAFADGGKNLTGTEKEIFDDLNPAATDTLQQALIKADSARTLADSRYRNRVTMMSPRQRGQVPNSITGSPNAPPGSATVRMVLDGIEYDVPAANVSAAEARGATRKKVGP